MPDQSATATNDIRTLRVGRGLTLQQVADAAGTTPTQVQRIETGKRKLTPAWSRRLAKAMGVEGLLTQDGVAAQPFPVGEKDHLFSERLKQARSQERLSQAELARRVGISPQAVQLMESGTTRNTLHLLQIAAALNVDPAWLSGEDVTDPRVASPTPSAALGIGGTTRASPAVIWEIATAHTGAPGDSDRLRLLLAGWEPFAVYGEEIWFKRKRV